MFLENEQNKIDSKIQWFCTACNYSSYRQCLRALCQNITKLYFVAARLFPSYISIVERNATPQNPSWTGEPGGGKWTPYHLKNGHPISTRSGTDDG